MNNEEINEFRHASWLTESVRGPQEFRMLVDMCKGLLAPVQYDFTVIVVSGLSGLLVGPTVALEMGKYLVAVRKDEDRHSEYDVEGCRGEYRYVILDDLISSGKTVRRLVESVGAHNSYRAKCIGVLLYRYNGPRGGKYLSFQDMKDAWWIKDLSSYGQVVTIPATAGDNVL